MIRDQRRDEKYFDDYISYQNERIEKFMELQKGLTNPDGKMQCARTIANLKKDLLSAEYSRGASKEKLKEIYESYLSIFDGNKMEEYAESVDALSLAILLDVDLKYLKNMLQNNLLDGLIETLLSYPVINVDKLKYPEYYQPFFDYLSDKIDDIEFDKYMLNEWYASNKEFAWCDSDQGTNDTYTGYWCWIAAACLKLKGRTESRNNPYIPYDMI